MDCPKSDLNQQPQANSHGTMKLIYLYFCEQERKLSEEKEEMEKQVSSLISLCDNYKSIGKISS